MSFKVAKVVYDDLVPGIEVEKEILGNRGNIDIITFNSEKQDVAKLIRDLQPYDGILLDFVPMTREIISRLDKCKVISATATGWDFVDTEAAAEKGIYVCSLPEYCTQEVADHTMMLLLALERRLMVFNHAVQVRKAWDLDAAPDTERVEGQTLGILGFGRIGQAVARRAKVFGLNIIAYDPYLPPDVAASLGVPLLPLDEVLASSHIITMHMAMHTGGKGFLDYEKFRKMAQKPFIINVARGSAVEEPDLIRALDEGLVKGAGLDVLNTESPDLHTHPLVGRLNVIMTPHIAFYSQTSMYLIRKNSTDNLIYVLEGNLDKAHIVAGPKKA